VLTAMLTTVGVSLDGEELDVADLVLLGVITDRWAPFVRDVGWGLALERDGLGGFSSDDLKERATRFRRARRLLSAAEFRAWLEARSLSVADLSGVLGRELRRERVGEGDRSLDGAEIDVEVDVGGVVRAEALCRGILYDLGTVALELLVCARRLERLADVVDQGDPRVEAGVTAAFGDRSTGIGELPRAVVVGRLRRVCALVDARKALRAQLGDADAVSRRLSDHGIDWLRLDGSRLRFSSADPAREARALICEDGLTVEEVEKRAGVTAVSESLYLNEAPRAVAGMLAAAAPGEVAGPWAQEDGWHLLAVAGKAVPSAEDPVLRERAIDELLADTVRREGAGRARRHGAL
jgi:hypothetical protein